MLYSKRRKNLGGGRRKRSNRRSNISRMRGGSQAAAEAKMEPPYAKLARYFTDDDLKNTKYLWEAIKDRDYTTPDGILLSVDSKYGKINYAIRPEFLFTNEDGFAWKHYNVTKETLSAKLIVAVHRLTDYDETYFIINAKDKEEAKTVLQTALQQKSSR